MQLGFKSSRVIMTDIADSDEQKSLQALQNMSVRLRNEFF